MTIYNPTIFPLHQARLGDSARDSAQFIILFFSLSTRQDWRQCSIYNSISLPYQDTQPVQQSIILSLSPVRTVLLCSIYNQHPIPVRRVTQNSIYPLIPPPSWYSVIFMNDGPVGLRVSKGGSVITGQVKLTFVLFTLKNSFVKLGHPAADQTIPRDWIVKSYVLWIYSQLLEHFRFEEKNKVWSEGCRGAPGLRGRYQVL